MIYVQQTDTTYDSVDFDDYKSTISYFKKLFLSFTPNPEDAEKIFDHIMTQILNNRTKKDSKTFADIRIHQIMKSAAERIHNALRELDHDSIPTTAQLVMDVMNEALISLMDLSHYSDDDNGSKYHQIRNNVEKDVEVTKDYEVLG